MVPVAYEECEALLDAHELLDTGNYESQEAYWDAVVQTLELRQDDLEEPLEDRRSRLEAATEPHAWPLTAAATFSVPLGGAYVTGFALSGDPVFLEGLLGVGALSSIPSAAVGKTYHDRAKKDAELAAEREAYGAALETARTVRDVYKQ